MKYVPKPGWYNSPVAVSGIAAGVTGGSEYLVLSLLTSDEIRQDRIFFFQVSTTSALPLCSDILQHLLATQLMFHTCVFCFIALAHVPEKVG